MSTLFKLSVKIQTEGDANTLPGSEVHYVDMKWYETNIYNHGKQWLTTCWALDRV